MDAWLKCHLAEILPIAYVSYAVDCSLPKATRAQRKAMVDATAEGFMLLKALGYPIRPAEDEGFFTAGPKRKLWSAVIYVMCKTSLGRLAATDHCAHAVSEMTMLDRAWEELRAGEADVSVNVSMPVWDSLRKSMPVYETMPDTDVTCLNYSPNKEAAYSEIFRVLKPGGIFCGCFYVKGENKRTDFLVDKIYTPKGYFTPPYETRKVRKGYVHCMYPATHHKEYEWLLEMYMNKQPV